MGFPTAVMKPVTSRSSRMVCPTHHGQHHPVSPKWPAHWVLAQPTFTFPHRGVATIQSGTLALFHLVQSGLCLSLPLWAQSTGMTVPAAARASRPIQPRIAAHVGAAKIQHPPLASWSSDFLLPTKSPMAGPFTLARTGCGCQFWPHNLYRPHNLRHQLPLPCTSE